MLFKEYGALSVFKTWSEHTHNSVSYTKITPKIHMEKKKVSFLISCLVAHFVLIISTRWQRPRWSCIERRGPNTDTFCKHSDSHENIWENISKCYLYILINILKLTLPRLLFHGTRVCNIPIFGTRTHFPPGKWQWELLILKLFHQWLIAIARDLVKNYDSYLHVEKIV